MDLRAQSVSTLFSKPVWYVAPPDLQRPYVWEEKKHWGPLWDDVRSLVDARIDGQTRPDHFFGAIVLLRDSELGKTVEVWNVIDGQQRLTTLQLLLEAAVEVFSEVGLTDMAGLIRTLVRNPDDHVRLDRDIALKVNPLPINQADFRAAMDEDGQYDKSVTTGMYAAKWYFRNAITHWLGDDQQEHLKKATEFGGVTRDSLKIVEIDVTEADDPHTIFETLNSRGTPLLQWDLIKSRLAYLIRDGAMSADGGGRKTIDAIESIDKIDWWRGTIGSGVAARTRVDQFLYYWLSVRSPGEIRSEREYRHFMAEVHNMDSTALDEITADLWTMCVAYEDLSFGRMGKILQPPVTRIMRDMQATAFTPLLLWLQVSELPDRDIQELLNILEGFLVRRWICGHQARGYVDLTWRLLRAVKESDGEAVSAVVRVLAESSARARVWPADSEFERAFADTTVYDTNQISRVRMMLERLERHLRPKQAPPLERLRDLTIEHVMPQTWDTDQWPEPNGNEESEEPPIERRNRLIHTFGNLTLHTQSLGSQVGNRSWEIKRIAYQEYDTLFLTKDILDHTDDQWDDEAIVARSKRLARHAIDIWPGPDRFKTNG